MWETGYRPEFLQDLFHWVRTDRRVALRLLNLMEVTARDPYSGIGKPEALKHVEPNMWSRRITDEHRLVYLIRGQHIVFLKARGHYQA